MNATPRTPPAAAKGSLINVAWAIGVWVRNHTRNVPLLGRAEPTLRTLAARVVPLPDSESRVTLSNGMEMRIPAGYPVARTYVAGLYEPEVTRLLQGVLQKRMNVVDGGANVGYYTLLASSAVGDGGHVYAFEPDVRNLGHLHSNVGANLCTNVTVEGCALADFSGAAPFIRDPFGAEGFVGETEPASTVKVVCLDDFFRARHWPRVDLVKLDIEGGEAKALRGMRQLSERCPSMRMIVEINVTALRRAGTTVEDMAQVLRSLGFAYGAVIERGDDRFAIEDGLPIRPTSYNVHLTKS